MHKLSRSHPHVSDPFLKWSAEQTADHSAELTGFLYLSTWSPFFDLALLLAQAEPYTAFQKVPNQIR